MRLYLAVLTIVASEAMAAPPGEDPGIIIPPSPPVVGKVEFGLMPVIQMPPEVALGSTARIGASVTVLPDSYPLPHGFPFSILFPKGVVAAWIVASEGSNLGRCRLVEDRNDPRLFEALTCIHLAPVQAGEAFYVDIAVVWPAFGDNAVDGFVSVIFLNTMEYAPVIPPGGSDDPLEFLF